MCHNKSTKTKVWGVPQHDLERSFSLFNAQEAVEALDVELTVLSQIRSILLITKVNKSGDIVLKDPHSSVSAVVDIDKTTS
jgi:hypothetical protein